MEERNVNAQQAGGPRKLQVKWIAIGAAALVVLILALAVIPAIVHASRESAFLEGDLAVMDDLLDDPEGFGELVSANLEKVKPDVRKTWFAAFEKKKLIAFDAEKLAVNVQKLKVADEVKKYFLMHLFEAKRELPAVAFALAKHRDVRAAEYLAGLIDDFHVSGAGAPEDLRKAVRYLADYQDTAYIYDLCRSVGPEALDNVVAACEAAEEWCEPRDVRPLRMHAVMAGRLAWLAERAGGVKGEFRVFTKAVTTLAFVRVGSTDASGPYRKQVAGFLSEVIKMQGGSGFRLAGKDVLYPDLQHVTALWALAELAARSKSKNLLKPAMDHLMSRQNADGGWGHGGIHGSSNTFTTTIALHALDAARRAGVDVDAARLARARKYITSNTDPKNHKTGYWRQHDGGLLPNSRSKNPQMTAAGLAGHVLAGAKAADLGGGYEILLHFKPRADMVDFWYWLFSTEAMKARGGKGWRTWRKFLAETFQNLKTRPGSGGYGAAGFLFEDGGEILATALAVLTLETAFGRK